MMDFFVKIVYLVIIENSKTFHHGFLAGSWMSYVQVKATSAGYSQRITATTQIQNF